MAHRHFKHIILKNAALIALAASSLVGCATLTGCAQPPASVMDQAAGTITAVIGSETFTLEMALTKDARIQGLSNRTAESIGPNGGMVFAFTRPARQAFVMRDCLTDLDILYVTDSGRVDSMHTMINEPRQEGEPDRAYDQRLKKYPSAGPVRVVIELLPGTLARLGVNPGDPITIDLESLQTVAR